ncbi:MAG: phosphoglycerate dehydrogenase [bacterium]|nr:phosphoglycerate dehydrogenase [bacterium]
MSEDRCIITVGLDIGGRQPAADILDAAGLTWSHKYGGPHWADEATREALQGVSAVLAGSENFSAHTLKDATQLRVIARNGVGYDKVDLGVCTERGIVVTYTPGVMADAVADLTFALLLAAVRRIPAGDRTIKAGGYDVAIGEDLPSMTLGLLGCGRIGAETVRRAKGFRMRVLVHDPYVDAAALRELGAEAVDRATLLAEADAISLHVPMSAENANVVNAEFLGAMKRGSYLINTARGGLVDEPALLEALRSGRIAGAGLDCQATEPPVGVSAQLCALDNVIASPHSGSLTITARVRMAQMAARSMVDVLQGRIPEQVVNREVLKKLRLQ